jgi:hypothetical protein
MITDDPGTPGDGHWEINIAALTNWTAHTKADQLPLIDLNYGVGERIQLKYEVPWIVDRGSGTSPGFGNSLIGVKWRFYDAGPAGWQVSTYPQFQFNLPSGFAARSATADPGTSWLLPLEFERAFDSVDINIELGRWRRPSSQPDSWIAGFVVGHQVTKQFEVMAELHDETRTTTSGHEVILNFGARRDLSEHFTVLMAVGRDLTDTLGPKNNLLAYLGLQTRL